MSSNKRSCFCAIRITTYDDLRHHIAAFAAGSYPFLLVIGAPGLGKSSAIKEAMKDRDHLMLDNHATAFALYESCFRFRDQPLILDDLDHLYRDDACIRLLKALCNTEKEKTLRWMSKHALIGDRDGQIPAHFTTTSPVCLLTNEWATTNEHVRAVEDRAIVLNFEPSAAEIHQEVGRLSQSRTVFEFMGRHLPLFRRISIRDYVRAELLMKANPDNWQELMLESMGVNERTRALERLRSDTSFKNEEERAQAFVNSGLGSRANYFRLKAEMKNGTTEPVTVSS